MAGYKQKELLMKRLRKQAFNRKALIGAEVGCGLTAKCLALGGVDFLVISNGGRLRMAGAGSLGGAFAFGDGNQWVSMMAGHIIPVSQEVPVFAALSAGAPFIRMEAYLKALGDMGFAGVMNNPSVGNWDEATQRNMERQSLGYPTEVNMLRIASQLDMTGIASCWTVKQAVDMAGAGADIIIAEVGLTTGGMVGAKQCMSTVEAAEKIQQISDGVKAEHPDVLVLCHGGPMCSFETVREVFDKVTGVDGFYGASATERILVEQAISENTRSLKKIRLTV